MDRYGGLVDAPGVPDEDGESWAEAADRLRGDRPQNSVAKRITEDDNDV